MTAPVRPRYGRIGAAAASVVVTVLAVLGGTGVLPAGGTAAGATPPPAGTGQDAMSLAAEQSGAPAVTADRLDPATVPAQAAAPVPADSGAGRRVVYSISAQQVWLVDATEQVRRAYPVSGSVHDDIDPGTYAVFSRSKHGFGADGSSQRYLVRFAYGATGAIGFQDVPVVDGETVLTRADLGRPGCESCVWQWRSDAKALWRFAGLGTPVVVTA